MYGNNCKHFLSVSLRSNSAVKSCHLMNFISSTIWIWKLNFVRQIISYGNFYLIIRKVKVHFYKGLMIPFILDNLNKGKSFVNTNSFFFLCVHSFVIFKVIVNKQ